MCSGASFERLLEGTWWCWTKSSLHPVSVDLSSVYPSLTLTGLSPGFSLLSLLVTEWGGIARLLVVLIQSLVSGPFGKLCNPCQLIKYFIFPPGSQLSVCSKVWCCPRCRWPALPVCFSWGSLLPLCPWSPLQTLCLVFGGSKSTFGSLRSY